MKFTKENITKIEADFKRDRIKGRRERIEFDDQLKGFGLRLQGNSRTWIVQYRSGIKQRRVKIGPLAALSAKEAYDRAKKIIGAKWKGEDEQEKRLDRRAKDQITMKVVADHYLERQQPKLRHHSFYEVSRYLLTAWKPLHDLPIDQIEQPLIADQLRKLIKSNGPISASRGRTALSALFTWAMKEGFCKHNPVIATNDPGAGAKPRDRVLDDSELAKVWNACADDDYGTCIKLLMLTGQRLREVGAMTWLELDQASGKWTIPAARTKNGREHVLTPPAAVWDIIKQVPRRLGNDHLFGRKHGYTGWSVGKVLLDKKAQIAPWVVHDLRRSVATGMADLGITPHVIEAVLNHISGHKRGVAGVYNRSIYERETRAALAAWADHVREITTGIAPTVVLMRREIPA